jgi:hypothetical protein
MIDFWAALGLAVVDEPFLAKVLKVREDPKALTDLVNQDYNFHLSRFEVAEFADFLGHSEVVDSMHAMHQFWNPKICEVSLTYDPNYVHVKPTLEMIEAMYKANQRRAEVDTDLQHFLGAWNPEKRGGHSVK